MGDNKVNMSLDDIIRMNKKNKQNVIPRKGAQRGGARPGRGGARTGRGGVRTGRGGAVRGGTKSATPRKGAVVARGQRTAVNNRTGVRKGAIATKKLVNQLIKKALKTQIGGSLAARRVAVANRAARIGRGAVVARVNRAGVGLGRVAARSRVIGRNRPIINRPATSTIIRQRGRGIRNGNLYQDEVIRPVVVQQRRRPIVVERVVQPQTRVIQRVVQRPRQQQRIILQQPIRQRVIQRPQQQRVIVVERSAPAQRVQKVIQRVQRPQIVRQRPQQTVQYVQARAQKNNAFRNALGINTSSRRVQSVQRFEPSTTFITRKVIRRGRGFQDF